MGATGQAASRRTTAALAAGPAWSGNFNAKIGKVYVAAFGTWAGWLTLQRSHDNGSNWSFVARIPAGAAPRHVENVVTGAWYRLGFAAADDYTSGTANVEMAQ